MSKPAVQTWYQIKTYDLSITLTPVLKETPKRLLVSIPGVRAPRWRPPEVDPYASSKDGTIPEAVLARRKMRALKWLVAFANGGWTVEFRHRQYLGLQTSARGELRRAELGRI
jgi:hypothetical protein